MERILVAIRGEEAPCGDSFRCACQAAAHPEALTFAPLSADCGADAAREALMHWQGEPWVLLCAAETRFSRHWDVLLVRELKACLRGEATGAALTGCLPAESAPVFGVSPLGVEGFDMEGRVLLRRGCTLCFARDNERTAWLHPDFCFAPAAFFRSLQDEAWPPSLAAFEKRWSLYTLRLPLLCTQVSQPLPPPIVLPETPALPRFGKHFGIDFSACLVSPSAYTGLPEANLRPALRVPFRHRVEETFRSLSLTNNRLKPLLVTVCDDMPYRDEVRASQAEGFRRLVSLREGVALLYCGDIWRKTLTRAHPNTLPLTPGCLLPVSLPMGEESKRRQLSLSKAQTLLRADGHMPGMSHLVWTDFGQPAWLTDSKAALNWQALCTDRIVMAEVDGVPDPSCFCVPAPLLTPLAREISGLCENALRRTGQLPTEAQLWKALTTRQPRWFEWKPLPERERLLSLLFSRQKFASKAP